MEQVFIGHITAHQALLFKVCRIFGPTQEARDDLFQDIVLQLWLAFPNYQSTAKWTTWAYRIALNVAISQCRKKYLPTTSLSGNLYSTLANRPADPTEAQDTLAALYVAIAMLDPAEKALVLLYLDELSYAEIAEITGISVGNVGVKLNRVKAKLRTIIKP
jgi:RNA polymerase sigma-70 factor, ECF subfamily